MNKADKLKEQIGKLQAELDRIESTPPVPIPQDEIDWSQVINLAQEHIADIQECDYNEDDHNDHWFYDAVMTAVYGKDIFKWINNNT